MRTTGEAMRFKVSESNGHKKPKSKPVERERDYQDEPTPVVPALNAPTPKERGGRPKKQTA